MGSISTLDEASLTSVSFCYQNPQMKLSLMGIPRIFPILLFSCFLLLLLSPSPGFGVEVMGGVEHAAPLAAPLALKKENNVGKSRKMMVKVDDYLDPGPEPGGAYAIDASPPAKA